MLSLCSSTHNNKTIHFIAAENTNTLPKEINTKDVCVVFTKKQDFKLNKFGFSAVFSGNPDVISFWINKKIDFLINPFNANNRGFDENTFSILAQNNILPVLLFDKLIVSNKTEQMFLFRHLFVLNKLCKKYKVPIIILTTEMGREIFAIYKIIGYNENQANNFLKIMFK